MTMNNSKNPSEKDEVALQAGRMLLKIGSTQYSLPNVALLFMLIGVLMPSVIYSTNLRTPTPAELLVTICIALFSRDRKSVV